MASEDLTGVTCTFDSFVTIGRCETVSEDCEPFHRKERRSVPD
jgi:hypothetical protein